MKKLMMMALAATVMFSCQKIDGGGDQNENGEAYAQVSFKFSDVANSKVSPEPGQFGDDEEDGKGNENAMTDALIIGYNTDGTLGFLKYMLRSDFTPTSGVEVTYTSKTFSVGSGEYNMYVVLNPVAPTGSGATTEDKYKDMNDYKTEAAFKYMKYTWATSGDDVFPTTIDGKFLMSSARGAKNFTADPEKNTVTNPAIVGPIYVERIVAKITYKAANATNTYALTQQIGGTSVGSVKFENYDLVNLRNDSYLLRRATEDNVVPDGTESANNALIGQLEIPTSGTGTATNYVVDNKYFVKQNPFVAANVNGIFKNLYSATRDFKELPTSTADEAILSYTLENTMHVNAQLNGNSTGIIFKAKVTPASTAWSGGDKTAKRTDGTFFKYNDLLFNNIKDIADYTKFDALKNYATGATSPVSESGSETIAELEALFNGLGIDIYTEGYCYYPFWIRHANNNNPTVMGIMEFAIVRNNIYKLSINSVSKIGKHTPDIDPEDPDEDGEAFLKVQVDILKWVVRNNQIDF